MSYNDYMGSKHNTRLKRKGKTMALEMVPVDITLHDRVGMAMIRGTIERGDTVTFNYDGVQRTVLVLEHTSRSLKGISKERDCGFRHYLFAKIASIQYAKPFVKSVPVTTTKLELIPDPKENKLEGYPGQFLSLRFTNKQGNDLNVFVHSGGNVGIHCKGVDPSVNTSNASPELFLETLTKFLAE